MLQKYSQIEYKSNQLLIESLNSISISSGVLKLKLLISIQNELCNQNQEYSDEFYENFIKDCKGKDLKYIEAKLKEINLI